MSASKGECLGDGPIIPPFLLALSPPDASSVANAMADSEHAADVGSDRRYRNRQLAIASNPGTCASAISR